MGDGVRVVLVVEAFHIGWDRCEPPVNFCAGADLRVRRHNSEGTFWDQLHVLGFDGRRYVVQRGSEQAPATVPREVLKRTVFDRQGLPQHPFPVGTQVLGADLGRRWHVCSAEEVPPHSLQKHGQNCQCCWLKALGTAAHKRASIFGFRLAECEAPNVPSVSASVSPQLLPLSPTSGKAELGSKPSVSDKEVGGEPRLYTYDGKELVPADCAKLQAEVLQWECEECLAVLQRYRIATLEDGGRSLRVHVPSAAVVSRATAETFISRLLQAGWVATPAPQCVHWASQFSRRHRRCVGSTRTAAAAPEPLKSDTPRVCTICLSFDPLTGPMPKDRIHWISCDTCHNWVHSWCLGDYDDQSTSDAPTPEHYHCPRCVAVSPAGANGPLKLGDMVWSRQSSSSPFWPAYVADPQPDKKASPNVACTFVVYYMVDKRGKLMVRCQHVSKTEVCRFTLDPAKVHPHRKKDRTGVQAVLQKLFPTTVLPKPSAPRAFKRLPLRCSSSPPAKRRRAASRSAAHNPPPPHLSTGASRAQADAPDLDVGVRQFLQGVGLEAEYAHVFRQHRITADLLGHLCASDLADMGVDALGDRKRILQAIENQQRG